MENTESVKKDKKFKNSHKLLIVFGSIAFILVAIIVLNYFVKRDNSKETFSLSYVSIYERNGSAYVNIRVDHDKNFTINASDFSFRQNNLPVGIRGIVTSVVGSAINPSYVIENDMYVESDVDSITLSLGINYSELPEDLIIMFRGQVLELGALVEFEYN